MALEIERRFLVKGNEWRNISCNAQYLRQGYLTTSINNWTVRIRIEEEENLLNDKQSETKKTNSFKGFAEGRSK